MVKKIRKKEKVIRNYIKRVNGNRKLKNILARITRTGKISKGRDR